MWEYLLQREVVIALAVIGAAAATLGVWLRQRGTAPGVAQAVYWGGYTITGVSIALFIIAGLWGVGP